MLDKKLLIASNTFAEAWDLLVETVPVRPCSRNSAWKWSRQLTHVVEKLSEVPSVPCCWSVVNRDQLDQRIWIVCTQNDTAEFRWMYDSHDCVTDSPWWKQWYLVCSMHSDDFWELLVGFAIELGQIILDVIVNKLPTVDHSPDINHGLLLNLLDLEKI